MSTFEQKRELISILLDSVYYLDLGLVERSQLVRLLMDSYLNGSVDRDRKAA